MNFPIVVSTVVLAIAGIFAVDLMLPLGIAVWLLYIPPLMLSLWRLKPAPTFFFTGLCSVLILLAYFNISVWVNNPHLALLNRLLAICTLWLTVYFGLRYKRALEKIAILASELTSRASELEAANKELEAFNYTVSHDLRKPLSGIIGYCEFVQERCAIDLDDECRRDLRRIHDSSLGMDQLIDTLLKFSLLKDYPITRERVNLTETAKEVAANLQGLEPDRAVTFAIAEGLTADADSRLMRVVLDNLLGNAWKYTSRKIHAKIEFGVTDIQGKKTFYVQDNGIGFGPSDAGKLFDAFQRLQSEYEGLGIGLATVKRIIDRHGGVIWAEGKEGGGATFYFCL